MCSAFRDSEWPDTRRSDEQRPAFVEIFASLMDEGPRSKYCREEGLVDRDEIDKYWRRHLDYPVGSVHARGMETWWYYGRQCMADICEASSAASMSGRKPDRSPPAPAPAPPPAPQPPRTAAAPPPPPPPPPVPSPPAGSETVTCTVTLAASVTNKQPINPSYLDGNQFWLQSVKPFWRTGRLMKFTSEVTRTADSDFWAYARANSEATDVANKTMRAMRERIWSLYAPGALDFNPVHRYEWCRNVKTGVVRAGSQRAPDFIPEEADGGGPQPPDSDSTVVTYNDGTRYEGSIRNGKPDGRGAIVWPNGNKYDGEWRNGERTGKGVFAWANGELYDGNWVDNRRSGYGIHVSPNGDYYDGMWSNDRKSGRGTFVWKNGNRFEGSWRDDLPTGYGTLSSDGRTYTGLWANGCMRQGDLRVWAFTTRASCGF
jgi:hypothetical protein